MKEKASDFQKWRNTRAISAQATIRTSNKPLRLFSFEMILAANTIEIWLYIEREVAKKRGKKKKKTQTFW